MEQDVEKLYSVVLTLPEVERVVADRALRTLEQEAHSKGRHPESLLSSSVI